MKKEEILEDLKTQVNLCKKCRLCETALNAVVGEGNPNAEIVFIGEAPGAQEDKTGRPFVGRAGKLLEGMLEKIGYQREDVWIGNVIKHRPPKNRDPLADEIKACEPFLAMQLSVINPLLVVTLGRFAMNYFYKEGKITNDHGKLIRLDDFNVFPVYHPAAGLRKKDFAKSLLKDFLKIPDVLSEIKGDNKVTKVFNNPLGL